jgi:UDP-N-acetylglucosamine 2-epimerase (non-hydrolysing)
MKKILFIFGTRPEAIKFAPLIIEFKKDSFYEIDVCLTGQHREMLDNIIDFFKIKSNYDLNLMAANQTLFDITSRCIKDLDAVLKKSMPDLVFVQGDTTSAMAGSLASYYKKIPVAHLEAGLRSGNKYSPFPEEINRKIIGQIADYHFAPTKKAMENLLHDGIKDNIFIVGNTVIDALKLGLSIIKTNSDFDYKKYFSYLDFSKKIILVTGHRRESFGTGLENICRAIRKISETMNDVQIVYPVHMNPNVQEPVNHILQGIPNVHLIHPLEYPYLIWLMEKSYMILTDSGGIQEEAPSLGKPVLVMRDVTERTEGIEAGNAILVGADENKIYTFAKELLLNKTIYEKMAKTINPYGDGKSSEKIVKIIKACI